MAPERKGLILAHEGHRTALRHAGKRGRDATPLYNAAAVAEGGGRREAKPLSRKCISVFDHDFGEFFKI